MGSAGRRAALFNCWLMKYPLAMALRSSVARCLRLVCAIAVTVAANLSAFEGASLEAGHLTPSGISHSESHHPGPSLPHTHQGEDRTGDHGVPQPQGMPLKTHFDLAKAPVVQPSADASSAVFRPSDRCVGADLPASGRSEDTARPLQMLLFSLVVAPTAPPAAV